MRRILARLNASPYGLLLLLPLSAVSCGPDVDVGDALHVESVTTGWVDAGAGAAGNKLVPAVSFKVRNTSGKTLAPVQMNAIFRQVGSADEWSNGLITAAGSAGLRPDAASDLLVIKGSAGYTGVDSQRDMLRNSHFVDARVDLFARYGSRQWARVGEYGIARAIVER
jgi:hypothetical protein